MKILGVLAVMGAFLRIGLTKVRCLKREIAVLEALARGIRVIRAELSSSLRPMAELLDSASRQAGDEAGCFFQSCAEKLSELSSRSFAEIWKEACRAFSPILSAEYLVRLEELGACLGRYGTDEQLAACDRFLLGCEETAKRLRTGLPEQRRLTLALCACAGIFLCLLIL